MLQGWKNLLPFSCLQSTVRAARHVRFQFYTSLSENLLIAELWAVPLAQQEAIVLAKLPSLDDTTRLWHAIKVQCHTYKVLGTISKCYSTLLESCAFVDFSTVLVTSLGCLLDPNAISSAVQDVALQEWLDFIGHEIHPARQLAQWSCLWQCRSTSMLWPTLPLEVCNAARKKIVILPIRC